jgi:hypothetical protein
MVSVPPVVSPGNGIDGIRAQAFTDEEIVEETACYNPLDNGIVCKLAAGEVTDLGILIGLVLCSHSIAPLFGSAALEVRDIPIEVCFVGFKHEAGIFPREVVEEVLNGTGVGINGFGALPFEGELFHEGMSSGVCGNERVIFPPYFWFIHV